MADDAHSGTGAAKAAPASGSGPVALLGVAGNMLLSALPIAGLFLVWELVVRLGFFNATLLSPPSVALPQVWLYFATGEIFPHLGASLQRGATGFVLAAIVGVPLGLLIGSVRAVSRAVSPVIEFLRQLPPLAMLPVFLLFLGLGFRAQVAIVMWAALWPVLLNTISGALAVDARLVKAARTLGAGRSAVFLKVALPSALPTTMTGMRLGASYAFLVLVAAEMVGADSGLGFLILNNQYSFRIPQMYAAILILAFLGIILNYGLIALERRLTPWRGHV
jgi:NitT/TauT family transport system permease protein